MWEYGKKNSAENILMTDLDSSNFSKQVINGQNQSTGNDKNLKSLCSWMRAIKKEQRTVRFL